MASSTLIRMIWPVCSRTSSAPSMFSPQGRITQEPPSETSKWPLQITLRLMTNPVCGWTGLVIPDGRQEENPWSRDSNSSGQWYFNWFTSLKLDREKRCRSDLQNHLCRRTMEQVRHTAAYTLDSCRTFPGLTLESVDCALDCCYLRHAARQQVRQKVHLIPNEVSMTCKVQGGNRSLPSGYICCIWSSAWPGM